MVVELIAGGVFFIFLLVIGAVTAAWLYTLVDAITRDDYDSDNEQLLWVLVILFAGIIGSIIYYFIVIHDSDSDDSASEDTT